MNICRICGQKVSSRCGGHIHIGTDYLTSAESYINLVEIWTSVENILYIICNDKGDIVKSEEGLYTRTDMFARPISPWLVNIKYSTDKRDIMDFLRVSQSDRNYSINFCNINNESKNTIEFRLANGTLNPDVWVENVRLFGRIIERSERLAQIEIKQKNGNKLSEEEKRLLQLKKALLEENLSKKEKCEKLLELLFEENEREVYEERYDVNSKLMLEKKLKISKKCVEERKKEKITYIIQNERDKSNTLVSKARDKLLPGRILQEQETVEKKIQTGDKCDLA